MSPIKPLQVVGFAKEVNYGVFVTPTSFVPASAADVRTTKKVVRPEQMRGIRGQRTDGLVGEETGASLTAELIPEVLSRLTACAFGVGSDTVSAVGGAQQHSLVPKNDLPSLSFELSHDQVGQLLSRQIPGCMVDAFTIRAQQQALATYEATLIGQTERQPATPGMPSFVNPTLPDIQPFDFSLAAISYAGGAEVDVMDLTVGFQNGVQRVFTSNQSLYVKRLVPTRRMVTLQANFDFVDLAQFTNWKDQTRFSGMKMTMTARENVPTTAQPYVIELDVRRLRAQDQFDLSDANDVLAAQLSYSATVADDGNEITSRWINAEAGALA